MNLKRNLLHYLLISKTKKPEIIYAQLITKKSYIKSGKKDSYLFLVG